MTPKMKSGMIRGRNLFAQWNLNGRVTFIGKELLEMEKSGEIRSISLSDKFVSQIWPKDIFKQLSLPKRKSEWSSDLNFSLKGKDYAFRVHMVRIEDKIITTATDIHDHMELLKENSLQNLKIRDLGDLFSDFIDHAEAHVIVVDRDFKIVTSNSSFRKLSGISGIQGKYLFSIPLEVLSNEQNSSAIRKVVRSGGEKVIRCQLEKKVAGFQNAFLRIFRADHVTVIMITFGYPFEMMNSSDRPVKAPRLMAKKKDSKKDSFSSLTEKEIKVLTEVALGKTNATIGTELSISPRTVDTHRRNIMKKLGVNHVQGLTLVAVRNGLI